MDQAWAERADPFRPTELGIPSRGLKPVIQD